MAARDWLYVTFVALFASLGSFLGGYSTGSVKTLMSDCQLPPIVGYTLMILVATAYSLTNDL